MSEMARSLRESVAANDVFVGIDSDGCVFDSMEIKHIRFAAAGKYEPRQMLVINDAPTSFKTARAKSDLSYPIVPRHEEERRERVHAEALDMFLAHQYADEYEAEWVNRFNEILPEHPPWRDA